MRRFVADASHELRTPLTSVRGFAELYRIGAVAPGEPLDDAMARIEAEASRMGVLVDDLLLLARLDQQRPLDRAPVDVVDLVADATAAARAAAPGRRIDIEVDAQALGVRVPGDAGGLRQVVDNLLANAMRYSPAEEPIVVVVGSDSAPAGSVGWATIAVRDRGTGMAPDVAARVFERFYRADPARSREHGGAGLGLAIVAAIVAAHGGRVDVESAEGTGSTFTVHLPRTTPAPAPVPAPAPGPAIQAPFEAAHVDYGPIRGGLDPSDGAQLGGGGGADGAGGVDGVDGVDRGPGAALGGWARGVGQPPRRSEDCEPVALSGPTLIPATAPVQ